MAGAAAFAAGSAYRKRSSLAFIFKKVTGRKDDEHKGEPAPSGQFPTKARALPVFYSAHDPPEINVAVDERDEERLSVEDGKNQGDEEENCHLQHKRLSSQMSSSSANSTSRPLMIVSDNAVELSGAYSDYSGRRSPTPRNSSPCSSRTREKMARRTRVRRQSSWKQPSNITRAIPYLSPVSLAYFCCFVNVILPGIGKFGCILKEFHYHYHYHLYLGTIIAAITAVCKAKTARSEFSPRVTFGWNMLAAALQIIFTPILFGWIYGVVWGLEAIERAKLLHLSELAEKERKQEEEEHLKQQQLEEQHKEHDQHSALEMEECITFDVAADKHGPSHSNETQSHAGDSPHSYHHQPSHGHQHHSGFCEDEEDGSVDEHDQNHQKHHRPRHHRHHRHHQHPDNGNLHHENVHHNQSSHSEYPVRTGVDLEQVTSQNSSPAANSYGHWHDETIYSHHMMTNFDNNRRDTDTMENV